jgi:hypothetical protein
MNIGQPDGSIPILSLTAPLNPLFATKISLGGLNRKVTEQKLDLLPFAFGGVANLSAILGGLTWSFLSHSS